MLTAYIIHNIIFSIKRSFVFQQLVNIDPFNLDFNLNFVYFHFNPNLFRANALGHYNTQVKGAAGNMLLIRGISLLISYASTLYFAIKLITAHCTVDGQSAQQYCTSFGSNGIMCLHKVKVLQKV